MEILKNIARHGFLAFSRFMQFILGPVYQYGVSEIVRARDVVTLERYHSNTKKQFINGSVYRYTKLVTYMNGKIGISEGNTRAQQSILTEKCIYRAGFLEADSYLEVGAGAGQNLVKIKERFPKSRIYGCDVSVALAHAKEILPNSDFRFIDLKQMDGLSIYEDKSVDHVFLMHVLEHVYAENASESANLRRNIINHMLRIARKSVILVGEQLYYAGLKHGLHVRYLGHSRASYEVNMAAILPGNVDFSLALSEYGAPIYIVKCGVDNGN